MATMQVETFEVQEVADEEAESSTEATRLIEELDLKGQRTLTSKNDEGGRCPYRIMTEEEAFVYGTLLPRRVQVAAYADGPIPLRVLQVLAHAKEIGIFKSFEVWCPQVPKTKDDPLLVAMQDWSTAYPLARWGEVLDAFALMLSKAAKKFREAFKEEAARITNELSADAARVETMPESVLISVSLPQLTGGIRRSVSF